MSGLLTLGLCASLLATLPPADGAGLAVVKAEARELQKQARYDDARGVIERFSARLADGSLKNETERLMARYAALDHAWTRARTDPKSHGRTFVNVLVAGGRWVPATDEDTERAVCLLARTDAGFRETAAATYRLDVRFAGADRDAFERALRARLSRCHLALDGGARALLVRQDTGTDRRGRFGGETRVAGAGRTPLARPTFLDPTRSVLLRGPATTPAAALGEKAAVRVMERVLLDVHHGRL